jgi:predicted DNA-binding WGR domain protein
MRLRCSRVLSRGGLAWKRRCCQGTVLQAPVMVACEKLGELADAGRCAAPVPASVFLKSVDPARNRARWYSVQVQPRLFGGVDIITRWGRIGRVGRAELRRECADLAAAERRVREVLRLRWRHGYSVSTAAASEY